jgi:phosphatidylserine/phosphatidylglycerophosphate/cardiolipin synthase-like enzyme
MLGPESRAARKVHERPGDHNMKLFRAAITSAVFVAIGTMSRADPAPTVHYAPAENLELVDVELIDTAQREIDFAAYVLTDWSVIQALTRAADRGVAVRIYLDAGRLRETEGSKAFQSLAETPSVEIRVKQESSALMHLKSYEIDGRLLRTGAANFSASGLKREDDEYSPSLHIAVAAPRSFGIVGRSTQLPSTFL